MSVSIAKTSHGFCCCGLPIEPGEMFTTRNGVAVHVGCENKARSSESAPTLFALTGGEQPAPQKTTRGFEAAYLDSPSGAPRLVGQLRRTFELMRNGRPWTLTELAAELGCLETSAGARMRDLRKLEHGGHMVVWEVRADGIREYRLLTTNQTGGAASAA